MILSKQNSIIAYDISQDYSFFKLTQSFFNAFFCKSNFLVVTSYKFYPIYKQGRQIVKKCPQIYCKRLKHTTIQINIIEVMLSPKQNFNKNRKQYWMFGLILTIILLALFRTSIHLFISAWSSAWRKKRRPAKFTTNNREKKKKKKNYEN